MKLNFNQLSNQEKIVFSLYLAYSILDGVILGVIALNEFVFLRSLHGSGYLMSLLFQFTVVVYLFLVFFNELLKRITRKRKLLRWTGIMTRLPFLIFLFFPSEHALLQENPMYHYIFLLVFFLFYMGEPIIKPTINLLLKSNLKHQNFGKLYGYATSANKIVMLLVTFGYGYLLDYDNFSFKYILPISALLSIISLFLLSNIRYEALTHPVKVPFHESVKNSIRRMVSIIKENRPYRYFEIAFMFYGFAFMMTVTVIYIYFEKGLQMNYATMAFYRNSYNILAIFLLPYFGHLMGKIDPRKFGMFAFASVMFYILSVPLVEIFGGKVVLLDITIFYILMLYVFFRGVFASTMPLLWNIGSAYFCKTHDADIYQSVHLSLTGFRALFAPLIGVYFYEQFGLFPTFILAGIIAGIGILVLYISYRKEKDIPMLDSK